MHIPDVEGLENVTGGDVQSLGKDSPLPGVGTPPPHNSGMLD